MIKHPILHLDGDSFFAACEIAKNPRLRGKPVVVGHDKGIATAMTIEAKKLGVSRGMPVFQIKKLFPQVIVLNSDFDTYQRFSQRAMNIVQRYLGRVEEYSIDECFADLTTTYDGDRDYVKVARAIKDNLERSLGITFSVGVASTKVLAKLASKREKPRGFSVLEPEMVHDYIAKIPSGGIWGIGGRTSAKVSGHGINTAGDLAALSKDRVEELFNLPIVEIWHELNGRQILKVTKPEEEGNSKSIQDTRSFRPPTADKAFLLAELSGHVEAACGKARAEGVVTNSISFFLKSQGGEYRRTECLLPRFTALPSEIMPHIRALLGRIYSSQLVYRACGVTLMNLRSSDIVQEDLFGESKKSDSVNKVYEVSDELSRRYGQGTVRLASSLGGREQSRPLIGESMPLQYLGEIR